MTVSLRDTNYQNSFRKKIHNMNCPICAKDIESIVKSLPKKKTMVPLPNYKTFKEKVTLILYKLAQKIKEKDALPKLFLWGQHYFDTKVRQKHYKRTQQTSISYCPDLKNPQQCINKSSNIQKDNIWPSRVYSRNVRPGQHAIINQYNSRSKKGKPYDLLGSYTQSTCNIQ